MVDEVTSERSYTSNASIIVLIAFALIEAASIIGVAPSLAMLFAYPISLAVSAVLVLSSLFGIYGILKESRMAAYFSLLTPTIETVLSLSFMVVTFLDANIKPILWIIGLLILLLGLVGLMLASKALGQSTLRLSDQGSFERNAKTVGNDCAVEVIDATKNYTAGSIVVPAVNGLSMKVRKGEFVAVMGPSGCGKSTLLNLIGALDRPTSGHVLIDGIDISKLNAYALAQLRNEKVGFVFQAYNLINRSNVLRNVELPMLVKGASREQRTKRTGDMLSVVGLEGMESRRPKTLSGGEQQRVAIARAFMNAPRIVLADEPTGNLDSKAGMEILSFLRETNKELGTTVIMVTHNREAGEMADRIIYLRDGRIEKEELVRRTPK
jgi:putative ABC transport system ATP-binding protein